MQYFWISEPSNNMTVVSTLIGACPTVADGTRNGYKCPPFSFSSCTPWSLDLPQVIVDGQSVHADRHSLGGDDSELLAVWAVLVELVDHLSVDGARSCAWKLDDLLSVRRVRVNGAKLAPAVTEEDDQVIGLALF